MTSAGKVATREEKKGKKQKKELSVYLLPDMDELQRRMAGGRILFRAEGPFGLLIHNRSDTAAGTME